MLAPEEDALAEAERYLDALLPGAEDVDCSDFALEELVSAAASETGWFGPPPPVGDLEEGSFEDATRSRGCGMFAEALASCGLLSELPDLVSSGSSGPGLTLLAPTDAALSALPLSLRGDPTAMRTLLGGHVCAGRCLSAGWEVALSIGGHSHCLTFRDGVLHSIASAPREPTPRCTPLTRTRS